MEGLLVLPVHQAAVRPVHQQPVISMFYIGSEEGDSEQSSALTQRMFLLQLGFAGSAKRCCC